MDKDLDENSGLIFYNGKIYSHNDSGGEPRLYVLDPATGNIERTIEIAGATNKDWEDIAQDEDYIFIGDFGNNNGNRQDLCIYRIPKSEIEDETVMAEKIEFSFEDQTSYDADYNQHNFDCEALISFGDSLYLFSKNWADYKTKLYSLPKNPGSFTATKNAEFNIGALVTGASVNTENQSLILSCYSNVFITPEFWVFHSFEGADFFSGKSIKLSLSKQFYQLEGVCYKSGSEFFACNEKFAQDLPFIGYTEVAAELSSFDIEAYLPSATNKKDNNNLGDVNIFPNPANTSFSIDGAQPLKVSVISPNGAKALNFIDSGLNNQNKFGLNGLGKGIYLVQLDFPEKSVIKKLIVQ